MLIRSIGLRGFAGLPEREWALPGRMVSVGGQARAVGAFYDALALALGAFSREEAQRAWAGLGFAGVEVEGEPLPESVIGLEPALVRALLDPEGDRTLRVSLEIELDPPQFRLVRQHALRDPELALALGEDAARLRLSLGWAFTPDLRMASFGVLSLRLGELSPRPGEVCPWRDELLRSLRARGRVHAPPAMDVERFAAADRSPEPTTRRALARARAALAGPPFTLGELGIVEAGAGLRWLAVGEALTPLRAQGPGASDAVALVQAVYLEGAEILALRLARADAAHGDWLSGLVEAESAPLEQVFLAGGAEPHGLTLEAGVRAPAAGLPLRR